MSVGQPLLAPYQRRWLRDRSKRKLLVKSRRIGGSFIVALENAMGAAGFGHDQAGRPYYRPHDRGRNQYIVSAAHNQAKNLLQDVKRHLEVMERLVVRQPVIASSAAECITLTNGKEIRALGTNPRTVRGYTGDLTLDEFGAMPRADEMWRAAKSVTDKTLGAPYGFHLRVVGTPLGDRNKFARLALTDEGKRFSRHTVDIHQAVAEGFPADIEELRDEAGDPDAFAEEYECAFLSAADRYISQELFEACTYTPEERPNAHGPGYFGMDVARKSTGDLSAICELERLGKTLYQSRPVETRRGATWDTQEAWVGDTLSRCQRGAVDATGMGNQFAERLQVKYGARIEPIEFTLKSKEMLATGIRLAMERHTVRWLEDDVDLKRDVLNLRREVTKHGNVRYDAIRDTERGGGKSHADRAWAAAMAVHAAGAPLPKLPPRNDDEPRARSVAHQLADYM
jgi:phage FluMu gp28-like protein